jgi:hypothetical protein
VPCLGDSLVTVDCFPQALFEKLWQLGIQLVTKNIKSKLLLLFDILSLRKHSIIVTANDQLKKISWKSSIPAIAAHLTFLLI